MRRKIITWVALMLAAGMVLASCGASETAGGKDTSAEEYGKDSATGSSGKEESGKEESGQPDSEGDSEDQTGDQNRTPKKLFENGPIAVQKTRVSKYGYVDQTGTYVIEPQYDYACSFAEDGLAEVKVNGKYGYIDKTGAYVIEPQFDEAWDFASNGLAMVYVDKKYGYIDKTGKVLFGTQYSKIWDFAPNGLARVRVNEKYGYIDKTGEFVILPQYRDAEDFNEDGLACVYTDEERGWIDKSGEFVFKVNTYVERVFVYEDGYILACKDPVPSDEYDTIDEDHVCDYLMDDKGNIILGAWELE